jgi:lysozyme
MKTSKNGVDFIKKHEGFRDTAYQCSAGVWTIGYGHTGDVKPGNKITRAEAEALLAKDLERYEAAVNAANIPNITQNQFDALTSLCYNIGENAFKNSTLARLARRGPETPGLRGAFMSWVNAGGKYNAGLHKRRMAEAELYFKA